MFKIKDMSKQRAEIEWEEEKEVWRTSSRSANTNLMKINLNWLKTVDTVNLGYYMVAHNHKWPCTSALYFTDMDAK